MMKMLDVIRQLKSLEEYLGEDIPTEARHDDEETAEYRKDVEALSAAISALEGLERNRAKAENAVKAMQICFGLAQDIERLRLWHTCKEVAMMSRADAIAQLQSLAKRPEPKPTPGAAWRSRSIWILAPPPLMPWP